jgi:hypothetical protein
MTTAKHTPGPWRIVARTDGLANVYAGATDVTLCARPRDARLIAAAPDLLEALREIAEMPIPERGDRGQPRLVRHVALCAIAKATGETT